MQRIIEAPQPSKYREDMNCEYSQVLTTGRANRRYHFYHRLLPYQRVIQALVLVSDLGRTLDNFSIR